MKRQRQNAVKGTKMTKREKVNGNAEQSPSRINFISLGEEDEGPNHRVKKVPLGETFLFSLRLCR